MPRRTVFLAVLAAGLAAASSFGQSDAPSTVSGRLTRHQGLPVLELWGQPEEAGFAHGYLLAQDILRLVDEYALHESVVASPQVYETMLMPGIRRKFTWPRAAEEELAAVLAGMRARIGAERCRSERLGRPLRVDDLMITNALADWHGMLCSTFSAWGALTEDGQTITARNLDFPSTPTMRKEQLVLIYHGGRHRKSWIGVTWPSLIGVYTAMNSDGVSMLMHDAGGLPPTHADGFTPRSLILREALEAAQAETFVADVRRALTGRRVMVGNNIHVSAPVREGRPPAVVFEYDANSREDGVTERFARHNDAALPNALWCTNHMRLRRAPRECERFARLEAALSAAARAGSRIGPATAQDVIGRVRQDTTLHTAVFWPARRTMHVSIPSVSDLVVEFKLDEWLARRGEANPAVKGGNPQRAREEQP
ncbi:MAG: hypothetical protein KKB50_19730 [Planctomycetes bacterium]|nr:hypothetical protein [Planctomycetota bacterium]